MKEIKASLFYKIVTEPEIDKAIQYIDENPNSIPKKNESTKHLVLAKNGKLYPPKQLLRITAKLKKLKIDENGFSGGSANKPFEDLGYKIISKMDSNKNDTKEINTSNLSKYWNQYKTYFKLPKSEHQEKYKWGVLKQVYEKWDWSAKDKVEMFKNAFEITGSKNLWSSGNFYPITHTNWMFDNFEEETINEFNHLFNEELLLIDRINSFKNFYDRKLPELQKLVPEKKINYHSHNDLRAIALYLTLQYPEKYFLFKYTMFKDFCLKLELPTVKKGDNQNLEKYNSLSTEVLKFIKEDKDFLNEYKKFTSEPENYNDDSLHLLTQDFIYTIATHFNDGKKYWRIGSNDDTISHSNEMLSKNYIAIGWNEIGDLEQQEIDSKNNIQELLEDWGFKFGNKSVLSRKSGEIFDFYSNASIDDIVTLMDGNTVLAIGKIKSDYNYDETKPFSHYRDIEWLKINIKDFNIKDGTQTSFYQLTKADTLKKIESELSDLTLSKTATEMNNKDNKIPLNQILYGPPGTGKTYFTKQIAIEIIDKKNYQEFDREAVIKRYDELVISNQIHFTTFHQSMSYEDFIEGIKPVMIDENENILRYEIQQGIFKTISKKALSEYYKQDILSNNNKPIQRMNFFDDAWNFLIEKAQKALDDSNYFVLKTVTNKELEISSISNQGNLIIRPKFENSLEYIVSYSRIRKLFEVFDDLETVKNIDKEFRAVIGGANITAYWSVLNFINQWVENNDYTKDTPEEKLTIKDDLIKFDNDIVKKNIDKKIPNYVLIIDEINRGNISSIFGELITLLEDDKRLGRDEAILVNLPYSKLEKFGVPPNLYIIGTMNTADRSVEALDTALRRRFSFTEIQYNPDVIELEHPTKGVVTFEEKEINLIALLNTINQRIEILIDKDHKIGHSYFINTSTFEELTSVFNNKVIPLLEEYFFGDFGKIGLVLGSAFIIPVENGNKVRFATNFPYDDKEMLREKSIYKFTDKKEWKVDSFISIYSEIN